MTIISKTKFLEFKSTPSPSGNDWFYVKRTNDTNSHDSAVVITTLVKINGTYNYLLLKTNRPPISAENKAKYCLESPAGLIGDINLQEDTINCAKKELLEEAGLVADNVFIELENSSTSAGLSCETLTYVTAIVNEYNLKQEPVSDGGIIIERYLIPAQDIIKHLKSINPKETSIAAATICGIFYAQERLNSILH